MAGAARVLTLRAFVLGLVLALALVRAEAQDHFPDPIPTISVPVVFEDFATIPDSATDQPARMNYLTKDPTGRLFVNDQNGPLYTVDATGNNVSEYLDLRDYAELDINPAFEAGFQSFTFHPDFANTGTDGFGKFYTLHNTFDRSRPPDFSTSGPNNLNTLLLEWHTDDISSPTFVPADEKVPYRDVLRVMQRFGDHNGGLVAFNTSIGPADADYGNMYLSLGDGGGGGDPLQNGQNTANPYGALLRIDPMGNNAANGRYGLVADNVFASDEDAGTLAEIYAHGFRNPQRYGWDSETGNLFLSDIGQATVEEVNLVTNGANYGWDEYEGSFPFEGTDPTGLTMPVAEFDHTNVVSDPPSDNRGQAVSVGEVARGTGIPGFDGLLPISDFPRGILITLDVDNDPLDGGQDGLNEVRPLDENLQPSRVLDLINQVRSDRGLSESTRADLRYGTNTPGEVYILNKHDGILRRLAPLLGDMDGNAALDEADVTAFVLALTDRATYESTYPGFDADVLGDLDESGGLSLGDVEAFKELIAGIGESNSNAVPEPGGVLLLMVAVVCSVSGRRRG